MTKLEKFEICEFGPFKFIGKTVYAAPRSGEIFGALWENSKEIFDALDRLTEYATEETNDAAYMNWSAEINKLGYTVGRFMKEDTPVPDGFDFFDVPKQFIGKSLVSGEFDDMIMRAPQLTEEAIKGQSEYEIAWSESFLQAEVYPKENIPKVGVSSVLAYYIPCKKKDQFNIIDSENNKKKLFLRINTMASLEKIEFITIPNVRIIGREVSLSLKEGAENPVPALWGKSFGDGTVDMLKKLPLAVPNCTIGWMGDVVGDNYRYIAGVIAEENTPVPEGLQYRNISACDIAKGYIHGNLQNGEVYCHAYDLTVGGITANHFSPDVSFGWSGEIYPDGLDFEETEGTICYFVPYKK